MIGDEIRELTENQITQVFHTIKHTVGGILREMKFQVRVLCEGLEFV